MASDELGKNEIASIREYTQKVETGFEKINQKVEAEFEKINQNLQVIRDWQIRADEKQKHYVTEMTLSSRMAPLENRIQVIEQKSPNYIQRSTMNEKIVAIAISIGIAVLTAVLTSLFTK